MTLETGTQAPSISASNQNNETVSPSFDEPTVVYFYPRDDTPGCTTEATEFVAEHEAFSEAGVSVYGVSTDTVDSHREFARKYDISFDLLADPDAEIADAFAVPHENGTAERTTFVINNGTIETIYEGVQPSGHAERVLSEMRDTGLLDRPSD